MAWEVLGLVLSHGWTGWYWGGWRQGLWNPRAGTNLLVGNSWFWHHWQYGLGCFKAVGFGTQEILKLVQASGRQGLVPGKLVTGNRGFGDGADLLMSRARFWTHWGQCWVPGQLADCSEGDSAKAGPLMGMTGSPCDWMLGLWVPGIGVN